MKIAFFSDCYLDLTGGIVSSVDAQKTALENLGHIVYIFSTSFPKSKKMRQNLAKKCIFPVPSCRLFFRGLTPISRRPGIIEKWLLHTHPELKDFDIFYIHYEAGCSIAGLRLAKKLNIPSVQVMHGREDMGETNIIPLGLRTIVAVALNWFHSWYLPHPTKIHCDNYLADNLAKAKMWNLMVNHANFADLVITPSAHFREKLIYYGVKKEIKVFPNAVLDQNFPTNPKVKTLKSDQELKIIWHSRVSAEKRMMPFLRALREVSGRYRLDVYGGGGDYFRAKRFVKHHKMNVKFHGNVKFGKISRTLAESHLDVLVSYNFDTFGMTLIEAEAAGTPVFICDPDMQEIIPHGGYILSSDESPTQMARSLNDLIKNPNQIYEMSENMLKHRKEILISNRIKTLEKIFSSLLNN